MIDDFLKSLKGIDDWKAQRAQIDSWAKEGQHELLLELAFALENGSYEANEEVVESLFDDIEMALSQTPGLEYAIAAIQMGQIDVLRK